MQSLPLPADSEKYIRALIRLDATIIGAFNAIRQLHQAIKTRSNNEEIHSEVLISLLTASWAVENSQEYGRQTVMNRDKQSYDTFMQIMKGLTTTVLSLTQRCAPYQTIPFNLAGEAMLCGGDIRVNMRTYIK